MIDPKSGFVTHGSITAIVDFVTTTFNNVTTNEIRRNETTEDSTGSLSTGGRGGR